MNRTAEPMTVAPLPADAGSPVRLVMRGISKRFGATAALRGVDLSVGAGEVVALVGENGAGKSTLMKVLSGACRPDEGRMWLDGSVYRPRTPMDARRAGVGMIYQELSLARHLSVMENILLGMEPLRGGLLDWAEIRRGAADAMGQLGRADISLRAPVGALSVAEQQLVEIARSIAVGCRVLVLDEPTSSLGRADIQRLFALVGRLKRQGHAIVYVSHFLEEGRAIADRFVVLRDGQSVGEGRTEAMTIGQIVTMMVGRQIDELYPRRARRAGEVVLELEELAAEPKPQSASLALRRGEVLGIAGLVGAGRTELLQSIFGLRAVRRGLVRIGAYVGPASPARRWAQGVGLLSEDRKSEGLALGLSIADNLTLSRIGWWTAPSGRAAACRPWIQRLAIRSRSAWQPVNDLSGGNQQKVAIARLLHHDVDLFLLDEPTRGIDVGSKAQIYRLIDELACQGRSVLLVSSYLPELMGVCDRIAVMCRGRLGSARPVEQTSEHQIMLEATGSETVES